MLTFKGGVHPPEGKEMSEERALETLPLPDIAIIPVSQHIGAPAEPIVKIGDRVKSGQKIAKSAGKISANIHSSVTGVVKAVGAYPNPVSGKGLAVVVERTGEDDWFDYPAYDPDAIEGSIIAGIAEEMGIVGMGGATFPTHVKITPPPWKKVEYVILNGAECEPFLTCDDRIMRERPAGIVTGLRLLMKATGAARGYVGIEHNKPAAIASMEKACSGFDDIEVKRVKTKYPQGAEKQLIDSILGRKVPNGGLPLDVGVVVHNVGTAYALYDAVVNGRPLVERAVTVSGGGMKGTANFIARVGDTFENLIARAGGAKDNAAEVISGGPMMGFSQFTVKDLPVTKGTSGILVFEEGEIADQPAANCISCASCVDVCPMKLLPARLVALVKNGRYGESGDMNLMACIECGSCAFVCPAKIPIVQYVRLGKTSLRKIMAREKAAKGEAK